MGRMLDVATMRPAGHIAEKTAYVAVAVANTTADAVCRRCTAASARERATCKHRPGRANATIPEVG